MTMTGPEFCFSATRAHGLSVDVLLLHSLGHIPQGQDHGLLILVFSPISFQVYSIYSIYVF